MAHASEIYATHSQPAHRESVTPAYTGDAPHQKHTRRLVHCCEGTGFGISAHSIVSRAASSI